MTEIDKIRLECLTLAVSTLAQVTRVNNCETYVLETADKYVDWIMNGPQTAKSVDKT